MDRVELLLQPHLNREQSLVRRQNQLEESLAEVGVELMAVRERIAGIREAAAALKPNESGKRSRRKITRNRGISENWKKILQLLDFTHAQFTYRDLANAAAAIGHEATNDTLRSQMSDYKKRGFVVSAGIGAFELTDLGRKAADIDQNPEAEPQKENEAPNGEAAGASEARGSGASPPKPQFANPDPWRRA